MKASNVFCEAMSVRLLAVFFMSGAFGVFGASGCADTRTAVCPDGVRCPLGFQCADSGTGYICIRELNQCGNGLIEAGEVCDDRNTVSGDGCSQDCSSNESCGNGIVDSPALDNAVGEACDDGNQESGDGCSDECVVEPCGNGILDLGETCDPALAVDSACADVGYDLGHVTCDLTCDYDTSDCHELGWTEMPPSGASTDLFDVRILGFGIGRVDMLAVGERGTMLRYDGSAWRREALPPGAQGADLRAIADVSPEDVFVVGQSAGSMRQGIVLHFNGAVWTELTNTPNTIDLREVWADENVVFAGGSRPGNGSEGGPEQGVILRLDRKAGTWTAEVPGEYSGAPINGVWASSACDVFAVTVQGEILHRDCAGGGSWSLMMPATQRTLTAIWGTGPTNVYAAGYGNDMFHYDGTVWYQLVGFPGSNGLVHDITGNGPDDIYVVRDDGVIVHFNGEFWQTMSSPPVSALFGVHSVNTEAVIAVGSRGAAFALLGWYTIATPASALGGIAGISSAGTYDVYAVSSSGLLRYAGGELRYIVENARYDLRGLWIAPSGYVVAVGDLENGPMPDEGLIITGNPEAGFREVPLAAGMPALSAVWGVSADDWMVVGSQGSIWHYRQGVWSRMATPGTADVYAIWGYGPNNVFAVGDGGAIWFYNGNPQRRWDLVPVSFEDVDVDWRMTGVWGSGPDDIFVVGESDLILHYDGTVWTQSATNAGNNLHAVWGYGPSEVYAVGGNGAVAHYNGTQWARINRQTPSRLMGIWGPSRELTFFADGEGDVHKLDRRSLPNPGMSPQAAFGAPAARR